MAIIDAIIVGAIAAGSAAAAHDARTRIQGWVEGKPFSWHDIVDAHKNVAIGGATGALTGGLGAEIAPVVSGLAANIGAAGGALGGAEAAPAGAIGATGPAVEAGAATPGPAGASIISTGSADVAKQGANELASQWHAPMALPETGAVGNTVAGPGSTALQNATGVAQGLARAPSLAMQALQGLGRTALSTGLHALPDLIQGNYRGATRNAISGLAGEAVGSLGNALGSSLSGAPSPSYGSDIVAQTHGLTDPTDIANAHINLGPRYAPMQSLTNSITGNAGTGAVDPIYSQLASVVAPIASSQTSSAVNRALTPAPILPTPQTLPGVYGQLYGRRRIV